jgi:hypothetical protein
MVRRNRYDPLQPLQQPTWLVVRNSYRQPQEWREIAAGIDLRSTLEKSRVERIAAGWTCEDIGRVCSFFFAERQGERIQVTVERYDPGGPGPPGHCEPPPIAPKVRGVIAPDCENPGPDRDLYSGPE